MKRNLSRRLELLFPVKDRNIRRRLTDALKTYFADNVKSWQLLTNGTYERIKPRGKLIAAQEKLYHDAVEAAREAEHLALTFRPLSKPAK
jgi:polyphosphate kinase